MAVYTRPPPTLGASRQEANAPVDLVGMAGPLLEAITRCKQRLVPSVDVNGIVRRHLDRDEPVFRAIAKLPKRVPVWNDDPDLPACVALDSPGSQGVFIYVGEPDELGEYPVARYDDQPEVWISEASLIHHVVRAADTVVHCTVDFDAALTKAKHRNAAHREGWSTYSEVQALISQY